MINSLLYAKKRYHFIFAIVCIFFSLPILAQDSLPTHVQGLLEKQAYEEAIEVLVTTDIADTEQLNKWILAATETSLAVGKARKFELIEPLIDFLNERDDLINANKEQISSLTQTLALNLLYGSQLAKALEFAFRMKDIAEQDPEFINSLKHGELYVLIGDLYFNQHEMKKAEQHYKVAMPIYERFSEDEMVLLNYYYRVAAIESNKSNYELALALHQKMLALLENQAKPNQAFLLAVLNAIALNYYRLGQYEHAIEINRRAINAYLEHNSKGSSLANAYNLHATVFRKISLADSAIFYAKEGLKHANNSVKRRLHEHILLSYRDMRQFDSAHFYARENKKISQDNEFVLSGAYYFESEIYSKEGKYDQALEAANHAFIVLDSSWQDTNPYKMPEITLSSIDERVLNTYGRKLNVKREISQELVDDKTSHALLLELERDYEQMLRYINYYVSSVGNDQSKAGFFSKRLYYFDDYLQLLLQLKANGLSDNLEEKVFQLIELHKSMELQKQQAQLMNRVEQNVPDSILAVKQSLQLRELSYQQKKDEQIDRINWNDSLVAVYEQLIKVNDYIDQHYPSYSKLEKPMEIPALSDWQDQLTDKEAMISYFFTDKHLYAVYADQKQSRFLPLGAKDSVVKQLSHFRELLSSPPTVQGTNNEVQAFQESAYGLYTQLLGPFEDLMPSKHSIQIFPDVELNLLPFESLVHALASNAKDFKQLNYLALDKDFRYAYSAALIGVERKEQQIKSRNVLAFGYSSPTESFWLADAKKLERAEWGELPATGREVQALSQLLSGRFYLDEEATESRFKSDAADFDMIHLAVHGKANLNSPYNSSLHFKNEKDEHNDGVLYAYELLGVPLKAQLVVLSACETGLGKLLAGEGVYSMARAFHKAGSKSQIISLWKANDAFTADIMIQFYQAFLDDDLNHHQALAASKRVFLEQADGISAHPYYWAAFVSMGEGVKMGVRKAWYWYVIGFLMLGLVLIFGFRAFRR